MNIENTNLDDLVMLCEVADDTEADITMSLLRACNIPVFKKYFEFAAVAKVYCGSSSMGVNLFVPSACYDEALEIINAPFDEDDFNTQAYGAGGIDGENEEG